MVAFLPAHEIIPLTLTNGGISTQGSSIAKKSATLGHFAQYCNAYSSGSVTWKVLKWQSKEVKQLKRAWLVSTAVSVNAAFGVNAACGGASGT